MWFCLLWEWDEVENEYPTPVRLLELKFGNFSHLFIMSCLSCLSSDVLPTRCHFITLSWTYERSRMRRFGFIILVPVWIIPYLIVRAVLNIVGAAIR